jgi:hypothetical protein
MKTMQRILFVLVFITGFVSVKAADLLVAENGAGGAYSSITAALNAAADGDRIFVIPKSAGAPYGENLTLNKSIQILCNVEIDQFTLQCDITITPAVNRKITNIGMKNTMGGISVTGNNPAGLRCQINLLFCNFVNGNINFDFDNLYPTIASSVINGVVSIRYGKVIGNTISATAGPAVKINTDAMVSNDTIWVVGNKLTTTYITTGIATGAIYWNNDSQFFTFSNNFIRYTPGYYYYYGSPYGQGINILKSKNSNTGKNYIVNNTIKSVGTTGDYSYGMAIQNVPVNSFIEIMNNVIIGEPTSLIGVGYYGATNTGVITNSFTFFRDVTTPFTAITNDGTNTLTSNVTIDADGKPAAGSDVINGGNADSTYYDINLTRNDAGCYGGSFTLDNFFPVTGPARVYFVLAPRRIVVGNTINIKAEAFDK